MKTLVKIPLMILCALLAFFAVTFTIYVFNLDMKATALLEPLLEKWYDDLPRDQYLESYEKELWQNGNFTQLLFYAIL